MLELLLLVLVLLLLLVRGALLLLASIPVLFEAAPTGGGGGVAAAAAAASTVTAPDVASPQQLSCGAHPSSPLPLAGFGAAEEALLPGGTFSFPCGMVGIARWRVACPAAAAATAGRGDAPGDAGDLCA